MFLALTRRSYRNRKIGNGQSFWERFPVLRRCRALKRDFPIYLLLSSTYSRACELSKLRLQVVRPKGMSVVRRLRRGTRRQADSKLQSRRLGRENLQSEALPRLPKADKPMFSRILDNIRCKIINLLAYKLRKS